MTRDTGDEMCDAVILASRLGFSFDSSNFTGGLGKAPRFDFPNELQRCLSKAAAGGIKPKDGRETVATPQHGCAWAVGWGLAQQFFELLALSDEARRIGR